jgi:hypothetical protein
MTSLPETAPQDDKKPTAAAPVAANSTSAPDVATPQGKAAAAVTSTESTEASKPAGEAKYLRPHLRVGDALNARYEIMHDISTGSFGHVIACKDLKQNGRVVAVKVQDRVEAKYHKGESCN